MIELHNNDLFFTYFVSSVPVFFLLYYPLLIIFNVLCDFLSVIIFVKNLELPLRDIN